MTRKASVPAMTLPVVIVTWLDAAGTSSWGERTEHADSTLVECRSVGFLLKKTVDTIVLAANVNVLDHVADSITIPWGSVRKLRYLR